MVNLASNLRKLGGVGRHYILMSYKKLLIVFFLQHPVLNKRLGIVILEGVLELLFQEQNFKSIFQKLHSRSGRVRNELRNSQRKFEDIRR